MAQLTLTNINKSYGALRVVNDVSFTVNEGEFVSLLGPSGCGKSTILQMIAGLNVPDEGQILVGDRDITRLPPHKRKLGLVFQSYALFPHMTVFENVAYGLRRSNPQNLDIADSVRRSLELVRMGHLAERMPAQLSGGQQQRVAVARSIAPQPAVLLLDEPLSNLDAKLRDTMQIELKRIQNNLNITTIFVTHDQSEALSMSDRVCIMAEGRMQQMGTPDEVYSQPSNAFVTGFLGRPNQLQGVVKERSGEGGVIQLVDGTLLEAARINAGSGDKVTVFIRPEGIGTGGLGSPLNSDLDAKLVLRSFAGQFTQIVFEMFGGSDVVATVSATSPLFSLESGQAVKVSIDKNAVLAFGG